MNIYFFKARREMSGEICGVIESISEKCLGRISDQKIGSISVIRSSSAIQNQKCAFLFLLQKGAQTKK